MSLTICAFQTDPARDRGARSMTSKPAVRLAAAARQLHPGPADSVQPEVKSGTPTCTATSSPARVPPAWGGPLNDRDYADLEASWITREIADEAMLRRVHDY